MILEGGVTMELYICMLIFSLILIPLVLGILVPIVKKHRDASGSVMNHDSAMREYVYKVYMPKEKIIDTLKQKNEWDEVWCEVDLSRSIIKFSKYGASQEYCFEIQEFENYSILKLKSLSVIQNIMVYELNPFIVNKLNAEVVPFEQYKV